MMIASSIYGIVIIGLILSGLFRYGLVWQGNKADYIWFLLLWALVLILWWGFDDSDKVTQAAYPDSIAASLSDKCEHNIAACLLRARLDFAAENYVSVIQHIEKAKGFSEDIDPLAVEMWLISRLYLYGLEDEITTGIQEYLITSDENFRVRLAYANALMQAGRQQEALSHYLYLHSEMPSHHDYFSVVESAVLQLSLQTSGAQRTYPL